MEEGKEIIMDWLWKALGLAVTIILGVAGFLKWAWDKISKKDKELTEKITTLDSKFDGKISALDKRIDRVESEYKEKHTEMMQMHIEFTGFVKAKIQEGDGEKKVFGEKLDHISGSLTEIKDDVKALRGDFTRIKDKNPQLNK